MIYDNPDSKRVNPFNKIYRSKEYTNCEPRDFPYIVDVELTNHCNLMCRMCSRQIMTRDKGFMEMETLEKVVDECARYDAPIRFIRWGEPVTHSNFLGACHMVKRKGLPLHITTNGLLLDEYIIGNLIGLYKVDSIIISMQGVTPRGYRKMRGGNYSKLIKNIEMLVDKRGERKKPFIHVSTTVTDEKEKDIVKFITKWRYKVDSVGVGKTNLSRINGKKPDWGKYVPCGEIYRKLSVDWDGKVTACCGDYDALLQVGDINETSLFNIWNYNTKLDGIRAMLGDMQHKCFTLCRDCYHAYEEF